MSATPIAEELHNLAQTINQLLKAGYQPSQARDYWGQWTSGNTTRPNRFGTSANRGSQPPPQIITPDSQASTRNKPSARGPGGRRPTIAEVQFGSNVIAQFLTTSEVRTILGPIWSALQTLPQKTKQRVIEMVWVAIRNYLLVLLEGKEVSGFQGWPQLADVYNELNKDVPKDADTRKAAEAIAKAYTKVEEMVATKKFNFVQMRGKQRITQRSTMAQVLAGLGIDVDKKQLLDRIKKANYSSILWPSFESEPPPDVELPPPEETKTLTTDLQNLAREADQLLKAGYQPSQARDYWGQWTSGNTSRPSRFGAPKVAGSKPPPQIQPAPRDPPGGTTSRADPYKDHTRGKGRKPTEKEITNFRRNFDEGVYAVDHGLMAIWGKEYGAIEYSWKHTVITSKERVSRRRALGNAIRDYLVWIVRNPDKQGLGYSKLFPNAWPDWVQEKAGVYEQIVHIRTLRFTREVSSSTLFGKFNTSYVQDYNATLWANLLDRTNHIDLGSLFNELAPHFWDKIKENPTNPDPPPDPVG